MALTSRIRTFVRRNTRNPLVCILRQFVGSIRKPDPHAEMATRFKPMLSIYVLCKQLGLKPGHLVEVGVNEPEIAQMRSFLESGLFEKVTLVEPLPRCAERLREAYGHLPGVQVLQAAITEKSGPVELYDQGESTFVGNLPSSPALKEGYTRSNVQKLNVEGLCFDEVDTGDIQILAIDTEGSEWWVISRLRSRPKIIVCETHLAATGYQNPYMTEILGWMAKNGYEELARTTGDTVWIRLRESPVTG